MEGDTETVTKGSSSRSKTFGDLLKAVERGDLEDLKEMLEDHELNFIIYTPLHVTVLYRNIALSTQLLNEGAAVDAFDRFGNTPLALAAHCGSLEMVKFLVENGANVNVCHPLHNACCRGKIECVQYLIEQGADVNLYEKGGIKPPLISAASKGDLDICKILLKHGAKVMVPGLSGNTALHLACKNGNAELVRLLITAGHDPNVEDTISHKTPLMVAMEKRDNLDVVKAVLGGNPVLKDEIILLPRQNEYICALVKYGVNINAQNGEGETALFRHSIRGDDDRVKCLLDLGADPNVAASGGWTALHVVSQKGATHVARELFRHKNINVNATLSNGVTPIQLAAASRNLEMVNMLLEHGASVNAASLISRSRRTSMVGPARKSK